MDIKKRKTKQFIKVVISEAIMSLSVIVMVIFLCFFVSGYWINQDFEVERSGLLQVESYPGGANVAIDGEDGGFFQRTSSSKVLTSGEHVVTLSKDGYDTWEKKINVRDGLLYRLHYPRLFLNERTIENVVDFENVSFVSVSDDRDFMLVVDNGKWELVRLDKNTPTVTILNVYEVFPTLANSSIKSIKWSNNGERILVKVEKDDINDWILINLNNIEKSLDLGLTYKQNFDRIEFANNSASNLFFLSSGVLSEANINSKDELRILAKDVVDFSFFDNEIVYISKEDNLFFVKNLRSSEDIKIFEVSGKSRVFLSKFYTDKYLTIINENKVSLFIGNLPSSMDDLASYEEKYNFEIGFIPTKIIVGHEGEYLIFKNNNNLSTLDMESMNMLSFTVENSNIGQLDDDMIFIINNGSLIVYDFDGFNRREIASSTVEKTATISDDKWLYYFINNSLFRENLLPR